ncbi:MAG: hypothetical protein GF364_11650, partial [Candidatus Lokiarchaeota archaeon]|nr:hypothetical protein [Candidatus Lokiarchaeota archaeon]
MEKQVKDHKTLVQEPNNEIQKEIFAIISEYFEIQMFKVINELFLPRMCVIYLGDKTSADNYQEVIDKLDKIGISSQLSRISKSQLKKKTEYSQLDRDKNPCTIQFDTKYLNIEDLTEKRKNWINSVISILITSIT